MFKSFPLWCSGVSVVQGEHHGGQWLAFLFLSQNKRGNCSAAKPSLSSPGIENMTVVNVNENDSERSSDCSADCRDLVILSWASIIIHQHHDSPQHRSIDLSGCASYCPRPANFFTLMSGRRRITAVIERTLLVYLYFCFLKCPQPCTLKVHFFDHEKLLPCERFEKVAWSRGAFYKVFFSDTVCTSHLPPWKSYSSLTRKAFSVSRQEEAPVTVIVRIHATFNNRSSVSKDCLYTSGLTCTWTNILQFLFSDNFYNV